jgi:hypothetical protein
MDMRRSNPAVFAGQIAESARAARIARFDTTPAPEEAPAPTMAAMAIEIQQLKAAMLLQQQQHAQEIRARADDPRCVYVKNAKNSLSCTYTHAHTHTHMCM